MSEPRTDAVPESDAPGPGGGDSVMRLHAPQMGAMNDPVMLSGDGTTDEDEGAGTAGGQDTVQAMHDIFMREQAEPHDGFEPVPFWVAVVCGALLMWGGYYLGTNTADFRRDVFDSPDLPRVYPNLNTPAGPDPDPQTVAELMKVGAVKYQGVCVACHKPDGNGDPGQGIPPLNGSEWVAGDQASAARLSRIVLYGLHQPITVKGRAFPGGQMPPQGGTMKDYEIAGVITYVRNSWDNKADPQDTHPALTAAVVKAARDKVGKRDLMTAPELLRIPLDSTDAAPAPKKDDVKK